MGYCPCFLSLPVHFPACFCLSLQYWGLNQGLLHVLLLIELCPQPFFVFYYLFIYLFIFKTRCGYFCMGWEWDSLASASPVVGVTVVFHHACLLCYLKLLLCLSICLCLSLCLFPPPFFILSLPLPACFHLISLCYINVFCFNMRSSCLEWIYR
jgi:hypothetical protein